MVLSKDGFNNVSYNSSLANSTPKLLGKFNKRIENAPKIISADDLTEDDTEVTQAQDVQQDSDDIDLEAEISAELEHIAHNPEETKLIETAQEGVVLGELLPDHQELPEGQDAYQDLQEIYEDDDGSDDTPEQLNEDQVHVELPSVEVAKPAEEAKADSRIDIRDHLHKLKPSDAGKDKYICPVCKKNDLYVSPKDGFYQCYSGGCSHASIKDALIDKPTPKATKPVNKKQPKKVAKLAEFNKTPDAVETIKRGKWNVQGSNWTEVIETHYPYANNQYIVRFDGIDPQGNKDKKIIHAHRDSSGKFQYGSAKEDYKPYRCEEWESYKGQYILFVEGEKCVELCRQKLGIVATTIRQSEKEMKLAFDEAIKHKVKFAYFRDYDEKGQQNEQVFLKVSDQYPDVEIVCLDPEKLFKVLGEIAQEKDDIEQWIKEIDGDDGLPAHTYVDVLNKNIVDTLTNDIKQTTTSAKKKAVKLPITIDSNDKGELEEGELGTFEEIRKEKGAQYEVDGKNITQSSPELVVLKSLFENGKGDWRCWNSGFYHYTGKGYWEYVPDKDVATDIVVTLPRLYNIVETKNGAFASHAYAKNRCSEDVFKYNRKYLNVKNFDSSCNHIVFNNCTLDLRTGEQVEHSRDYLTTHHIDSDYIPNQECPDVFKNFIADSYGIEYLDIIRAFTASFLDSTVHFPFFPYLLGKSGSGKGVLARFWSNLFPETSVRAGNNFEMISSPDKRHQNLTGVRLYTFPDMSGYHKKLGDFYELVDNGRLSGRALFDSAGYEKKWDVHFIVCSVYPLLVENASEGWDRRAIPLATKERTSKNDPHLEQKLKDVIPQVLSWALAMPKEERYTTLLEARNNPKVAEKRREIDILSDNVKSFIDRCLQPSKDRNSIIEPTKLYQVYQSFCKTQGQNAVGNPVFVTRMKAALGKYFVDRKSVKRDGKVEKIPARWNHLSFVTGLVNTSGEDYASGGEIPIKLDALSDGGLEELDMFWNQPSETNIVQNPTQIMINDILGLPNTEEDIVYLRVAEIGFNEKGQERLTCVQKDGSADDYAISSDMLICDKEYCTEIGIDPTSFALPEVGSWVEVDTGKRETGKKRKVIAYVQSVIDYAFLYQESSEQKPKIHGLGWRKLNVNEYYKHGLVHGQIK